jgi:hypothetical protein
LGELIEAIDRALRFAKFAAPRSFCAQELSSRAAYDIAPLLFDQIGPEEPALSSIVMSKMRLAILTRWVAVIKVRMQATISVVLGALRWYLDDACSKSQRAFQKVCSKSQIACSKSQIMCSKSQRACSKSQVPLGFLGSLEP